MLYNVPTYSDYAPLPSYEEVSDDYFIKFQNQTKSFKQFDFTKFFRKESGTCKRIFKNKQKSNLVKKLKIKRRFCL